MIVAIKGIWVDKKIGDAIETRRFLSSKKKSLRFFSLFYFQNWLHDLKKSYALKENRILFTIEENVLEMLKRKEKTENEEKKRKLWKGKGVANDDIVNDSKKINWCFWNYKQILNFPQCVLYMTEWQMSKEEQLS